MLIMSDRALQALEQDQFKFGAQASLAVVTLGSNAQAATSTALNSADIIVWASASGAYAGLTLEGSLVKPRGEWNDRYYGRQMKATRDTHGTWNAPEFRTAGADGLRQALYVIDHDLGSKRPRHAKVREPLLYSRLVEPIYAITRRRPRPAAAGAYVAVSRRRISGERPAAPISTA